MNARTSPLPVDGTSDGCCGGLAKADATACCVLDEAKRREGEAGCGCARPAAAAAVGPAAAPGEVGARDCCG